MNPASKVAFKSCIPLTFPIPCTVLLAYIPYPWNTLPNPDLTPPVKRASPNRNTEGYIGVSRLQFSGCLWPSSIVNKIKSKTYLFTECLPSKIKNKREITPIIPCYKLWNLGRLFARSTKFGLLLNTKSWIKRTTNENGAILPVHVFPSPVKPVLQEQT